MSATIRVTDEARQRIARLAAEDERPMTAIVDEALDALERRRFFEQYNRRYAELADDEAAWAEIVDERTVEAGAITDGR